MPAKNKQKQVKPTAAAKPPWLVVRNQGEGVTEMVISGVIGSSWYDDSGTTSKEFREKFGAIAPANKVRVLINSEGGSVSDALEIYNILQGCDRDVTTVNMGYALSSASIILLGGKNVVAPASSLTMIHEPWSMTMGDEAEHLKAAEMLSKHGDTIAGIYAKRTGKPASEMRDLMRAETWFTGDELLAEGFSDATEEDDESDAERAFEQEHGENDDPFDVSKRFAALDLTKFRNVPEKVFAMLRPAARNATQPQNTPDTQTALMDRTKILAALKKAGIILPDNATDEQVLAAFDGLTTRNAAPATATATNAAPATPAAPVVNAEVEALRTQLNAEKRTRVRAEVLRRGENRIQNQNIDWWTNLAMTDEAGTFAQIDALPVTQPGGQPIGQISSVVENRLEEINKHQGPRNASKRYNMLREDWDGMIADALRRDSRNGTATSNNGRAFPVNSNSYSATLVTQFLLDGAVT